MENPLDSFLLKKETKKSPGFQRFLGGEIDDLEHYKSCLERMKNRIEIERQKRKEENKFFHEKFELLALACFKYDYHGATSNWDLVYHHEDHMIDHTQWILETAYPTDWDDNDEDRKKQLKRSKSYKKTIDEMIELYQGGYIPDGFKFMNAY